MVNVETIKHVSIPITGELVKIRDLRDLVEALEDAPEDSYVVVDSDELRYEVGS